MQRILLSIILLGLFSFTGKWQEECNKKWQSIFDGVTLKDWKVGANSETFKVENGAIVVNGNVSHLFYDGPINDHDFKDFEFKADVMTMAGANSGIYFHTEFQQSSWPKKGYEVQVNNSHTDWRRTGSLYAIQDIKETYVKDSVWYTERIKVKGKNVKIFINNKMVVDYTEPENAERQKGMEQRLLDHGTFALQGHDPKSKVLYKNIMVKVLD